jgi:Cu-Zn family superoxide dismutase
MSWAYSRGDLTDLSPLTADVYDGARATVVMFGMKNQSTFRVSIRGLSEKAIHQHYGAHLHTGPCGLTDPKDPNTATVGPHYNTTPLIPGPTSGTTVYTKVSDQTEVWLNFHVDADRDARDTAVVSFVPDPKKARSITFHASHTIRHESEGTVGSAGAKLACLPLDIKQIG